MIARVLDAFTRWALKRYPASVSSSAPVRFGAYVIKDQDAPGDEPYITRVLFPRVFGFRPMLHHIHRPDYARELHNHPWAWAFSLVLSGSYTEQRDDVGGWRCSHIANRRVRWFNFLRGSTVHRIAELQGDVWTLFVTGPRTQGWGFREWDHDRDAYGITPHEVYRARLDSCRNAQAFARRGDVWESETAGEVELEEDGALRGVLGEYGLMQINALRAHIVGLTASARASHA